MARLARFGLEAWLAVRHGERIVGWMETTAFEVAIGALVALAVAGTAVGVARLVRAS